MFVRKWWTYNGRANDQLHAKSPHFRHSSTKKGSWIEDWSTPQWMTEALNKDALSVHTCSGYGSGTGYATELRSSQRDSYSWAALLSQRIKCGQGIEALKMYEEMLQDGVEPGRHTFLAILKECSSLRDLDTAKLIHRKVLSSGFESDLYVGTMLVDIYAKCGSVQDARRAFEKMPRRDVVSWNAIILGYAQIGNGEEALQLFARMRQEGVVPDVRTYVGTLKASSNLARWEKRKERDGIPVAKLGLEAVRAIHADIREANLESNVFVGNMLVDAYAKCGSLQDASRVFKEMPHRTVVSWNTLILGYAQLNEGEEALKLYTQMKEEGVVPSDRTYVSALKACSSLTDSKALNQGGGIAVKESCLEIVRAVHRDVVRSNLESDLYVGNMLMDVYAKCGSLGDARRVFEQMPYRDVVSWNAMIFGYGQMDEGDEALQLFTRMRQEGVVPNDRTYVSALKACSRLAELKKASEGDDAIARQKKCLETVRAIHTDVMNTKFESDVFVCNMLVDVYAKFGILTEAMCVFKKMPYRDVVSWNAIILGYAQRNKGEEALQLFAKMQLDGVVPNERTYVSALKACSALVGLENRKKDDAISMTERCLEAVRAIHAHIVTAQFESDVFVGTMLVDVYIKCGSLEDARCIFEKMPHRTIVSWTAMILGYAQRMNKGEDALQLFSRMREEGVVPNDRTYVAALKACASVIESVKKNDSDARRAKARCLETVRSIHSDVVKGKFESDVFVGTMLVDVYAKCGSLMDARHVFENMPYRDLITWNAIILGYAQMDRGEEALQLFARMQQEGLVPTDQTYVGALKACSSLAQLDESYGVGDRDLKKRRLDTVRSIHTDIVNGKFDSDVFVGTMLVDAYAKCGSLTDAVQVFSTMPHRDVVSWNAMILGYANLDKGEEALQLFFQMQQEGVVADDRTFVSALKACSSLAGCQQNNKGGAVHLKRCLETVRVIHREIVRMHYEWDVFVENLLVDVYAKCGSLEDARNVFEKMPDHTVISWTAIIFGYAQMDKGEEALQLFARMQQKGQVPDARTYIGALKACISLAETEERNGVDRTTVKTRCLETVRGIHADLVNGNFDSDVFVATMLVDVYSKFGSLEDARAVFEKMSNRSVVSWNALILGYAQMGECQEALYLYSRMQQEGVVPDDRTYVGALKACGCGAGLEKGKEIHAQILEAGREAMDPFVTHSLINMYGKCGSMVDAQQVFDATQRRETVAWNALIAGYANQGESELVFELFRKMKQEGVQPDSITFLAVLTVCSHVGLVVPGQKYFEAMSREHGINPTIAHYTCMVDLLGRAGHLDVMMEMVEAMPVQHDLAVWSSVLGACRTWGQVELGRMAFESAVRVDKNDATAYVMMSNIYAAADMLEEANEVQAMRVESQAWKQSGQSWWMDMSGIAHSFVASDQEHPERQNVYAKLGDLMIKVKHEEQTPHNSSDSHHPRPLLAGHRAVFPA